MVKGMLEPKNVLTIAGQRKVRKTRYPNFPFVNVPNPDVLARNHLSLNQTNITAETRQEAADFFRIPEGTRVLFVGPEYCCREELMADPKFQVKDEKGNITGVAPCCPWCTSNSGVSFRTWEVQNHTTMPRSMINMDATRMPLLGVRYWCNSKECVGAVPRGDLDEETGNIVEHDAQGAVKLNDTTKNPVIWRRSHHLDASHSFVIWNPNRQIIPSFRYVYGESERE